MSHRYKDLVSINNFGTYESCSFSVQHAIGMEDGIPNFYKVEAVICTGQGTGGELTFAVHNSKDLMDVLRFVVNKSLPRNEDFHVKSGQMVHHVMGMVGMYNIDNS